jgi:hypothetical protein
MNITLLKHIRASAQEWWYHRELRARGQTAEAQLREHASMRRAVDNMRFAKRVGVKEHGDHCILFNDPPMNDAVTGQTIMSSGIHRHEWRAWCLLFGWKNHDDDVQTD